MIAVTGATGNVGSRLLIELAELGAGVRALVRTPDKGDQVTAAGAQPVVGTFEDPSALAALLSDVEVAFLLSPPGLESMVTAQTRVIDAAREAGVGRVVKLSSIAAEDRQAPAIVAAHRRIEEHLENSGLNWTHLRPHWFMQNELGQAGSIATDGVFYAPDVTRIAPIDVRDIARVAAHVCVNSGHDRQAYTLTGPQLLTYADVASIYSDVLGRPVRWEAVTIEQARASMLEAGLGEELSGAFAGVLEGYGHGGVTAQTTTAVREITGRAPIDFATFVRDHREAFGG